jgi:hypothetical protein
MWGPEYLLWFSDYIYIYIKTVSHNTNTVEPLITDTAGEFKFCPL